MKDDKVEINFDLAQLHDGRDFNSETFFICLAELQYNVLSVRISDLKQAVRFKL